MLKRVLLLLVSLVSLHVFGAESQPKRILVLYSATIFWQQESKLEAFINSKFNLPITYTMQQYDKVNVNDLQTYDVVLICFSPTTGRLVNNTSEFLKSIQFLKNVPNKASVILEHGVGRTSAKFLSGLFPDIFFMSYTLKGIVEDNLSATFLNWLGQAFSRTKILPREIIPLPTQAVQKVEKTPTVNILPQSTKPDAIRIVLPTTTTTRSSETSSCVMPAEGEKTSIKSSPISPLDIGNLPPDYATRRVPELHLLWQKYKNQPASVEYKCLRDLISSNPLIRSWLNR
jgi:hypothetical protein